MKKRLRSSAQMCDFLRMSMPRSSNPSPAPDTPDPAALPRYMMLGGFLGAGKSTSVLRLAHWLSQQGRRVGLISNDQGSGLVDTALFASHQFPVQEIPGGCFCCRFDSLVEAAAHLTASTRPDVFIAEPVGSCTDLVATVTYPLRQIYGGNYSIAPLSVLVDPTRAARLLGLTAGAKFTEKVAYIYRKQLEEADLIVVNKCDLLDSARQKTLRDELGRCFPQARLFEVSARRGDGLEPWFRHLLSEEQIPRAVMEMDYQTYADGEARLGWLNGTVHLQAPGDFDPNALLQCLAREIQTRMVAEGAEVAHLKMTFDPRGAFHELAVINLVDNSLVPELSLTLPEPVPAGELTVNLRAEAQPEVLHRIVTDSVQQAVARGGAITVRWRALESFQPGKPQPTHRVQ